MRMLRLSGLDSDGMTDDQRDAFVNMAENLGIEPGDAEDLVDVYLEEIEAQAVAPPPQIRCDCGSKEIGGGCSSSPAPASAVRTATPIDVAAERAKFPNFISDIGAEMLLVPSGSFPDGKRSARCRAERTTDHAGHAQPLLSFPAPDHECAI